MPTLDSTSLHLVRFSASGKSFGIFRSTQDWRHIPPWWLYTCLWCLRVCRTAILKQIRKHKQTRDTRRILSYPVADQIGGWGGLKIFFRPLICSKNKGERSPRIHYSPNKAFSLTRPSAKQIYCKKNIFSVRTLPSLSCNSVKIEAKFVQIEIKCF